MAELEEGSEKAVGLLDQGQGSEKAKASDSSAGDEIILEVGKKVKFSKEDAREFSVEQIMSGMGQAKRVSEFESKLQKTENESKQLREQLEQTKRDLELAKVNQRIAKIENPVDDDDDIFKDLDNTVPEIPIRQNDQSKQTVSKLSQIEQELAELKKQQREQVIKQELEKAGQADEIARKAKLKRDYGASEEDTQLVIGHDNIARYYENEARNAPTNDEYFKLMGLASQSRDKAVDALADIKDRKRKADAKSQRDQELLKTSNANKETVVVSDKPILDTRKAQDDWANRRKLAQEEALKRERLRGNTG